MIFELARKAKTIFKIPLIKNIGVLANGGP